MGTLGSTQELEAFGQIFGGSLALAIVVFVIWHFTRGLPTPEA